MAFSQKTFSGAAASPRILHVLPYGGLVFSILVTRKHRYPIEPGAIF